MTVFFLVWLCIAVTALLLLACTFKTLRRSLHMYQQASYQNPTYRKWLRDNRKELFAPARWVPLAVCALCMMFPFPALLWLAPLCAGFFVLINRRGAAKKPLAYTPRIKRLIVTAAVLSVALSAGVLWLWAAVGDWLPSALGALLLCGWAFGQPWLVILFAAINSPVERAVNRRYVGQARDILRSHKNLTVIGITGSYGKTSTKYFLGELLAVKYNTYLTPGNYNTTLGVVRAVREGLKPIHEVFLCEMGARHRGDIAEICDLVRPRMGVLTYIGPQHLETFGSQQAVTDTKLELARAVEAEGGTLFVNWGSDIAAAQAYKGPLIRYGTVENTDYRAQGLEISDKGSSFTVEAPGGESARFQTRLLGEANVQNITGAIAVAHTMGIPLARLVPAVRALKGVEHRLELKPGAGMTLIDDAYNSNPMGAKNALNTLALCAGSRIVITPGLVELGDCEEAENLALGAAAARSAHYLVTVGRHPGGLVAQGARDAGMPEDRLHQAADIHEALAHVKALSFTDKFVLLLNDLPDSYR